MGPGGMGQSGGHAPNHLNDAMAPGLPNASVMQSQMSNGEKLLLLKLDFPPPADADSSPVPVSSALLILTPLRVFCRSCLSVRSVSVACKHAI